MLYIYYHWMYVFPISCSTNPTRFCHPRAANEMAVWGSMQTWSALQKPLVASKGSFSTRCWHLEQAPLPSQTAQLSASQKKLKLGLWCCWQWGSWCGFWPRARGIWVEDQCQWVWAWDGHFSEHKGEILLKLGFCWEKEEVGFLLRLFALKSLRGWFLWIKRDFWEWGFYKGFGVAEMKENGKTFERSAVEIVSRHT